MPHEIFHTTTSPGITGKSLCGTGKVAIFETFADRIRQRKILEEQFDALGAGLLAVEAAMRWNG